MPSLAKPLSILLLTLSPLTARGGEYSASVRMAQATAIAEGFAIDADINYQLSPTAREALLKGVPLSWNVLVDIRRQGWLIDDKLYEKSLPFFLEYNALLNQYEVKKSYGSGEMFQSLNAALNFMAKLHHTAEIRPLPSAGVYRFTIRCGFNREYLPVPLRPSAYLDSQWALSSDWHSWSVTIPLSSESRRLDYPGRATRH